MGFPGGSAVKNPPAVQKTQETQVRSLSGEDPGEGLSNLSSVLAWRISWSGECGGQQSMGLQRAGHN